MNSPTPSWPPHAARKRALYQATVQENPWVPDDIKAGLFPKQVEFLCYEGREALYGGAAGGGKSVALLVAALQFVEELGYAALILRRTYKQLAKSDSILSKAKEWLLPQKVRYSGDEYKFTFPNGATIEFGHMENDNAIYNYQGGSWQYIGVDEVTQFTESMLSYPRTRQRRVKTSRIPIRWRGGSNPGGVGHEYVKARYVKGPNGLAPTTPDRQFFPATIDDNPHIDRDDYIKQLKESGVDGLLLAQLLEGDWDAVAGGKFKAEWFPRYQVRGDYILFQRPGEARERTYHIFQMPMFMTVDPAASAKNTADWTVAGVWLQTPQNELALLDADRFQADIPDVVPRLESLWRKWRRHPGGVWIEAVAANDGVYKLALRSPMPAKALNPHAQDKLVRATPAISYASAGRIWLPPRGLVPGMPLDDIESEWYRFTGNENLDANDDAVDMLTYGVSVAMAQPASANTRDGVPMVIGGGGA
jgi:hypothetical protein